MNNTYDESSTPVVERGIARSWPVRVITLLLLLQAIGLGSISISKSTQINWRQAIRGASLSAQVIDAVFISGMFISLAILAVLAAFGVLWMFRIGWLLAMLVQAVILLICLVLYFHQKPVFVYPLMLSCIILVLYLNSFDVRLAFYVRPPSKPSEAVDEY